MRSGWATCDFWAKEREKTRIFAKILQKLVWKCWGKIVYWEIPWFCDIENNSMNHTNRYYDLTCTLSSICEVWRSFHVEGRVFIYLEPTWLFEKSVIFWAFLLWKEIFRPLKVAETWKSRLTIRFKGFAPTPKPCITDPRWLQNN